MFCTIKALVSTLLSCCMCFLLSTSTLLSADLVADSKLTTASDGVTVHKDVKKILFIGDSITYAGHYVNYVEAYLRLNVPTQKFEFINVGLPSETVSGLSEEGHANGAFPRPVLFERLARLLNAIQPDLVFTNYGINDGIYMPYDDLRFEKYKVGMQSLHEALQKENIPVIHITPPIYDDKKDANYANVVHTYADWLLSQKAAQHWQVLDAHWPMQRYLNTKREMHPEYFIAKDGIHPNKVGHSIIAITVLNSIQGLYQHSSHLQVNDEWLPMDKYFIQQKNGKDLLMLVTRKQALMKDAWLSHTKHLRPRMKQGLALSNAKDTEQTLNKLIQMLLDERSSD